MFLGFVPRIERITESELSKLVLNEELHYPRLPVKKFTANIFREKIDKFIEYVCHDFLKKYCGILTAYLQDYKTLHKKI